MIAFVRSRFAACVCAATLIAACGTLQPPIATHDTTAVTPGFSHYRFFSYTGRKKTFKVPAGVSHLKITLYGANGGLGNYSCCSGFASSGGAGGMVTATIPVTPGESLAIFVGGSGGRGGFNGGAAGAAGKASAAPSSRSCGCGGGGGASDVRQGGNELADRVLVAGGGGGGGTDGYDGSTSGGTSDGGNGGYGGALIGGPGEAGSYKLAGGGGGGGTQNAGGKGGAAPNGSSCNGSEGTLGAGGPGGPGRGCGAAGGGGGGGYYGGGGGGAGGDSTTGVRGSGGGGGGGSSFTEARATHVKMTDGGNPTPHGDGTIIVFW